MARAQSEEDDAPGADLSRPAASSAPRWRVPIVWQAILLVFLPTSLAGALGLWALTRDQAIAPLLTSLLIIQTAFVCASAALLSWHWSRRIARRIATIAAGYADGLFRTGSAGDGETGGQAIVRGTRVPFVGRISMDLVTLDITGVPGEPVGRGDWAELIGPGLAIEDVGRNARTIGYEVLTSLSRRFHRVYAGGAG